MSSQSSKLNPETLVKMRASQAARKEKNDKFRRLREEEKATKAANEPVLPVPPSSVPLLNQPSILGSDPKQVEAAAIARLMMRIKAAREDPCEFVEFCMRTPKGEPIKLAQFQREWLRALQTERRLLIVASRHSGKTTLLIAFCLWMLGRNPNLRIKIFCQNDARAQERVYELKQGIEKNPAVKLVFPDLKPSETGEWSKTRIVVQRTADIKDASVEAVGITTSVTGGRVDVILCDDVVDQRNSITYPSMREQIKKKFFGEMLPMLDPAEGKCLYIATPWHNFDLTAVLKVNSEWRNLHYAIGVDGDPMRPLWPEKWPREALEAMRREMGVAEFDRAFRCVSVSDDVVVCKPEWIKYYSREILGNPHNLMCVQAYDLAIGQNSKSDYFAGVTLLYDMERNIAFVADFLQTRCSFMEQANIIVNNYNRWNADRVWVETTGLGGGMFNYLLENSPKKMPLTAYKPRGDKQRRLMEVSPWLENGYVYFHPNMDPQRHVLDADRGDIITQLLDFPLGKHDDIVDALVAGISGLTEFKSKEDEDGWNEGTGIRARLSVMG